MKFISTFLLAIFISAVSFAQSIERQVITFTGQTVQTDEVIISYSAGEPVVGTISNDEHMLTQGFQQPGPVETEIDFLEEDYWRIAIYPNPVADQLNIRLYQDETAPLYIDLIDILGRKVHSGIQSNATDAQVQLTLSMSNLATGVYMVRVANEDQSVIRSYKVTKVR